MPEAFCTCCRKTTPHKVVMRRATDSESSWHAVQSFLSKLFSGDHYYPLEQQMFCRACNSQSAISNTDTDFSDIGVAKA